MKNQEHRLRQFSRKIMSKIRKNRKINLKMKKILKIKEKMVMSLADSNC